MKEVQIFSPRFIYRLERDGYPVADITDDARRCYEKELNNSGDEIVQAGQLAKSVARQSLHNWTEYTAADISAAAYDENQDRNLPRIIQAIGTLAQKWLDYDLIPPPVTVKEVSRITGFSPQKITKLISKADSKIEGIGQTYTLELTDDIRKSPIKKAVKQARYESRPPGGGPVQRARFQKRRLSVQLNRLNQERNKIGFIPIELQPESPQNDAGQIRNLQKSIELVVDPDIADIIGYFKKRGGRKYLRGIDESEFSKILRELSAGRETDVLVWNCLDFKWLPPLKRGRYPVGVVRKEVEMSIVKYNFPRFMETLEFLSLLGPITPIVLIPSNEAFSPMWNYAQPYTEREYLIKAVVGDMEILLSEQQKSFQIDITRWDDYIKSRGIVESQETLTQQGADIFRACMSVNPVLKRDIFRDEKEYFGQFGISVDDKVIEKFAPYYFGVYTGEGIAFSKIIAGGRPIILIDFEEGRVAKAITAGVQQATRSAHGKDLPIISPVSPQEKLNYYNWKKAGFDRIS